MVDIAQAAPPVLIKIVIFAPCISGSLVFYDKQTITKG